MFLYVMRRTSQLILVYFVELFLSEPDKNGVPQRSGDPSAENGEPSTNEFDFNMFLNDNVSTHDFFYCCMDAWNTALV